MVTIRNAITGREWTVEHIETAEELDDYMSEHDLDMFDQYEVFADFLDN